jgi:hypothetical protein
MTEERKFAILFAATILAARKLIDMDPNKSNHRAGPRHRDHRPQKARFPPLRQDRGDRSVDQTPQLKYPRGFPPPLCRFPGAFG